MRQLRIRASVLSLSVLLVGSPLGAADKYWTGAAGDGRWWNAANWSGNSFAGWGDTVIFTNDAPLTLSRAGHPGGNTASANRIYRFEGADVTFVRDGALSLYGKPGDAPQPEIYVAAGTTVTISNDVSMLNSGSLVKTGSGTVRQYGVYGEAPNNQSVRLMSEACPFFRLAEGQWIMESPGAGAYCMVTNMIVEAGTTFALRGYNSLNERAKWTVNGTFRLDTCWSSANISTLVGSGRVESATAAYPQNLQILNGVQGPSSFSGTIGAGVSLLFTNRVPVASSDFTFTLGAADVFADADLVHGFRTDTDRFAGDLSALRFAPGIGAFDFKNIRVNAPLTLSATATDGQDIEVRLNAWQQTTSAPVTLTLADGRFCGAPTVPAWPDANRTLPEPGFITMDGAARRNLVISGSDVYIKNNGEQLAELTVQDGGVAHVENGYQASAEKPAVVRLDGGTLLLATRDTQYHHHFPAEAAADNVSVVVGAAGATIGVDERRMTDSIWSHLNAPVDSAVGVTDGGLELRPAYGPLALHQPIRLSGGVSAWGGRLVLASSAALRETPKFLGLGDVSLASTLLLFNDFSVGEETTLEIPGALAYDESVTVNFRSDNAKAANAVSCGSLVRAGAGAVLFLYDTAALGSASTFKVAAAPATHANGLLKQPVVLDSSDLVLKFAAVDDGKGLVPFAGMKTGAAAGEGDVLTTESGAYTVPAGTEKRVLGVAGSLWKGVTIPATATLKVGNGTDPALVLLNTSAMSGDGTLDFGTSEGVIAANYHPYANAVNCRIAGSGGVTFAASAKFQRNVVVSGANVYSGGTRVTSVDLWVRHATAFGTDDVFVLGDVRNGGKLLFDRPLTMANDFHVSGWGHPFNEWNISSNGYGAVVFKANAVELTGAVELVREARLSAEEAGDVGRLSGVVSGGRLSIYKGEGLVELLNENTYTGGTEVVRATVAVAKGGGLGTGTVTLDQGVLRFVNTEAITFTNAVEGVGTIVLAGTAPVTFEGASFAGLPFATLAAGTSIDLASPADSVYVPFFAGETDLGGRQLTVGGVAGSGRVSNGVLTVTGEISPAGEGAVGTLAFAAGTLVSSGATYVCDVADGAADRLVVGGDFDLSTLKFRAVRCGRARGVSPTVLEAANGSLSGAFASVTLARDAWQVAYGERTVNLDLNAGLLLLVK